MSMIHFIFKTRIRSKDRVDQFHRLLTEPIEARTNTVIDGTREIRT